MEREKNIILCACLLFFPFADLSIIFGTSFQSSQHNGDMVLLKLCNDFLPTIKQIQNFPK